MDYPPVDMGRQGPDKTPASSVNSEVEGAINSGIAYPQIPNPDAPRPHQGSNLQFMNPSRAPPNFRLDATTSSTRGGTVASSAGPSSMSTQFYPYHQQAYHQYYNGQIAQGNIYLPQNAQSTVTGTNGNHEFAPPVPPKPTSMPIQYPTITRAATSVYNAYDVAPGSTPIRHSFTTDENSYRPTPPHSELLPLQTVTPAPPIPNGSTLSPTDESNDLALALAMSQSESNDQRRLEEQEEEELARALAESMLSTSSDINNFTDSYHPDEAPSGSLQQSTALSTMMMSPLPIESPTSTPISISVDLEGSVPSVPHAKVSQGLEWPMPTPAAVYNQPIAEECTDGNSTIPMPSPAPSSSLLAGSSSPNPDDASILPYLADEDILDSVASIVPDTLSEERKFGTVEPVPKPPDSSGALLSGNSVSIYDEQTTLEFDDEAYARQLAAEEEEMARQEEQQRPLSGEKRGPLQSYPEESYVSPPIYQQTWQGSVNAEASVPSSLNRYPSSSSSLSAVANNATIGFSSTPFPYSARPPSNWRSSSESHHIDFRQMNSIATTPPISLSSSYNTPHQPTYPSLRRRESNTSSTSHHSSTYSAASVPLSSIHPDVPPSFQDIQRLSATSQATNSPSTGRPLGAAPAQNVHQPAPPQPAQTSPSVTPGMLNAHHFLDAELLNGVSIGFTSPVVSNSLRPMKETFPTLISMPYSRCPPLHLQAPDWRHLLRLMARLSQTKIQATLEAASAATHELKLRTVVQFIKPHTNAKDWRTIVWFTIDHPVPPNAPGASRYLSGNTNLLPWSYTQSSVPMLLRSPSDTAISKTFTIPATDQVPLPTLPITFPNLALYLQAALDNSRRYPSDSSSGVGKLGKIVHMCYPYLEQSQSEFGDTDDRSSVTHLFKRVIGRGKKDSKGKTSNNEETYQLVTPFVPDEWG